MKKRDGVELTAPEIAWFIDAFMKDVVTDYQMSAFCMAVFFRGMTDIETVALTTAMTQSGSVLDLSHLPGAKVDKHSTGGVGDKVSIALAPLVAACGVTVPMVSGRGLGHTGGTLDKLEAIPGFNVRLDEKAFIAALERIGVCMIGQTPKIAPADRRLYALRDVTGTVEAIPLIVASILSKKLAEGIDALVLDVKVGRGAFMKDLTSARALASRLTEVASKAGKRVTALLTDMSVPLGLTIGNANETREAIELLHGKGPADLLECTLALSAEMLILGGAASGPTEAREKLQSAIDSGRAVQKLEKLIEVHGGLPAVATKPDLLALAPVTWTARATRSGYVTGIEPMELGLASVALGAGRTRVDQQVDPAVGIDLVVQRGAQVRAGDPLALIRARGGDTTAIQARVQAAFAVGDAPPLATPLILDRIG